MDQTTRPYEVVKIISTMTSRINITAHVKMKILYLKVYSSNNTFIKYFKRYFESIYFTIRHFYIVTLLHTVAAK